MDLISNFLLGMSIALTAINLWYLTVGVGIGLVIGAFPGLGPAAGIAILLPLTFTMEATSAIIMLAGIYYGAMYGAGITAILINTPGAPSAAASTFDGYPLTQRGRAGPALVMQAAASFVGGTIGIILLTALAPAFSRVARSFGPPEFFLIVLLGILTIVFTIGEHRMYGLISALLGFALATVGIDVGSGQQRFTFGSPLLIGGIGFIPVAIGLFGVGELLNSVARGEHKRTISGEGLLGSVFWPSAREWMESRFALVRGTFVGFGLGVIPGAGATIASFIAYAVEKALSRTPERFGRGAMAGLAAPEAANNAASSGALIPLLSLGIPGSASTAVLLGAFVMWGLRPGPLLFTESPEFAWSLIASMYLGNIMLVLLCLLAIPMFVAIIKVPFRILAPVVMVLCTVGSYSVNGSMLDAWVMFGAGVLGFFMKQIGFSPAALVVALVLGPLAENTLQQSLIISDGSLLIFVTRPISLAITILIFLVLLGTQLVRRLRSVAPTPALPEGPADSAVE
jgi:putative tricarboxylic transport membrane protein